MKNVIFIICLLSSTLLQAQDEFIGTYVRAIDQSNFEIIQITDSLDCYQGLFIEQVEEQTTKTDAKIDCYMDGEDYFFLVISWEDYEFEISPLQWDDLGQIAAFELLPEFELEEPLIFYRNYQ